MFQVEIFWIVSPYRWRQHGPPKRWYPTTILTRLHNPEGAYLKYYRRESLRIHIF